ncbi:hypothetical protein FB45DRAFT_896548 [Roridomyces roridus]|uniref:Uncharacterized protein n=1 Tax=Roridomyces roridus TaxID=1738132 RepID=A0AAD7CBE3_9AGAR|nr:hypothetical protein FB45DRAFT_896548 [Roridomyces roridus]
MSRRPPVDYQNGRAGPSIPPQLRPGPQQRPEELAQQPQRSLQRQPSRPDDSLPPQLRAGPQPQYGRPTQPPLQRQPSRPDQPQPMLQRQPSRPEEDPRLQRQPSRPDQYSYQPQPPLPVPVTPAFAQGPPTRTPPIPNSVSQTTLYSSTSRYADSTAHIIRGNEDDNLDRSSAFWRHFNASAQQEQLPDIEKSSWLEKTQGKSSRTRRTLWIVGIIFLLLAAGGIGIGVYLSVRSNDNESRPSTFGGSADVTGQQDPGSVAATAGGGGGAVVGGATSTSLHVSPTNTVP